MNDSELLTAKEAAEILKIATGTLANWRVAVRRLPFLKIGRMVRYRRSDVERMVRAGTAYAVAIQHDHELAARPRRSGAS